MNFCPPKPGSTVMTRAMSMWFAQGASSSTVVPGFMAKPTCRDINTACQHELTQTHGFKPKIFLSEFTGLYCVTFMPLSFISLMRFPGLVVASKWNVYWLAPAAAIGFTHCSGRDTIMCMSATQTLKKWRPLSDNYWLIICERFCLTKEWVLAKWFPQAFYHGMAKCDVWHKVTLRENKTDYRKSCSDVHFFCINKQKNCKISLCRTRGKTWCPFKHILVRIMHYIHTFFPSSTSSKLA